MDVEAELAYVDILRTLQNSILNSDTNVSCQGSVQLTGDVAVAVIMTLPQPRFFFLQHGKHEIRSNKFYIVKDQGNI